VRSNVYLKCILSLFSVVLVVWLASRHAFYSDTISSPFLGIALLSVFLILLRTRFSLLEIGGVFVLVMVLAFFDLRLLGYRAAWPVGASFAGLAGLAVLASRAIWSEGSKRRLAVFALVPAFLFVASEWCADYFLAWTKQAHPNVLDLYLYSFDASLHVQIPFVVGRLFQQSFYFGVVSFLFYLGLPLAIGLAFAGCLMRDRRNALSAFLAFLLTGPIGGLLYNLFPALGPVHIFKQSFPWHPLTIEQASRLALQAVPGEGARNAMPSLHAAWVFLVLWYSWNLSMVEKIVAGLIVFFTLCATVGLGEHYFVDLVVAVPFSLFIVALASLLAGRDRRSLWLPLLVGLGVTGIWFVALRTAIRVFWLSPVIPWLSCVLTLLACFLAVRKLADLVSEPAFEPFVPQCPARVKAREA
jgi:PAP2 superfamily